MTLTEHLIQIILAMDLPKTLVGQNPTLSGTDALAIRDGMLHADDPYPGIVIDLASQEHEKDLLERGGLVHASVNIRCISFSKTEAWALRSAVAFDGQTPHDAGRTKGLDGYANVSGRLIAGIGLRTENVSSVDSVDGEDRDIWIVESTYNVDYWEQ